MRKTVACEVACEKEVRFVTPTPLSGLTSFPNSFAKMSGASQTSFSLIHALTPLSIGHDHRFLGLRQPAGALGTGREVGAEAKSGRRATTLQPPASPNGGRALMRRGGLGREAMARPDARADKGLDLPGFTRNVTFAERPYWWWKETDQILPATWDDVLDCFPTAESSREQSKLNKQQGMLMPSFLLCPSLSIRFL